MPVANQMDSEGLLDAPLERKIEFSKEIIWKAVATHGISNLGIAITGGKDSTLTLWLLKAVCQEKDLPLPKCMFIDEGDLFDEVYEFVRKLETSWSLDIAWMKNYDVAGKAPSFGEEIIVADLNEMNRRELELLDFRGDTFPFDPESYVGNHLMKTVPMNIFINKNNIQALITAIRWDEQDARIGEHYFSPRERPEHNRVHPILHFRERDVWKAIHSFQIPFCELYRLGYRSLGARSGTAKLSDLPAWEQDLENTVERSGRAYGKEEIMEKLRDLGYM